jgi:hypothetical protein
MVRVPRYSQHSGPNGAISGESVGQVLVFNNGTLTLPLTGTVVLEDGREGDAAELVDFVRNHRLFNDPHEGVVEVVQAAPPVSQAELEALVDAIGQQDVDTLERLITEERGGWNRDGLLGPAEKALGTLQGAKAAKPAAK